MKTVEQNIKNFFWAGLCFVLSFPVLVFADHGADGADHGSGFVCDKPVCLTNPLPNVTSIPVFVKKLLDIVLTVGVPIVALAIIWSGFLFVKAQGKPEELKKAKQTFMYTIIGAAILLGAYVLAEAVGGTVAQLRN